jgi:hypothetical protein
VTDDVTNSPATTLGSASLRTASYRRWRLIYLARRPIYLACRPIYLAQRPIYLACRPIYLADTPSPKTLTPKKRKKNFKNFFGGEVWRGGFWRIFAQRWDCNNRLAAIMLGIVAIGPPNGRDRRLRS